LTANQVTADVQFPGAIGPGQNYFDPTAFAAPAAATLGTSGYYRLRGPGATNLDLSIFRNFSVTERIKLQFRAESFNLSNTPHFANPNASIATPSTFGQITQTAITSRLVDPRYMRLGVRIIF